MKKIDFVKIMARDRKVGALTVSSKYVVQRITSEVCPEYKYIVEYGPGEGIITRVLLDVLALDARLVVIETNPNFVSVLKNIKDDRLVVIEGDVNDVTKNFQKLGIPHVDMVISGIPFSLIKNPHREEIIQRTHDALSDDGVFMVYQYSPFFVFPLLKKYFNDIKVSYEIRNFLPYFLMRAVK